MALIPAPPFHPDMKKALLEGRKSCASRNKRLGEIGDCFVIDKVVFRFVDIRPEKFGTIAYRFYRCEGFATASEFMSFWMRLHRGALPLPDSLKWLHILERVTP